MLAPTNTLGLNVSDGHVRMDFYKMDAILFKTTPVGFFNGNEAKEERSTSYPKTGV